MSAVEDRHDPSPAHPPRMQALARLPIDRVFTMRGFGTVVTGTLISGTIRREDELEVFPSGRRVRVRGLQVHGKASPHGIQAQAKKARGDPAAVTRCKRRSGNRMCRTGRRWAAERTAPTPTSRLTRIPQPG